MTETTTLIIFVNVTVDFSILFFPFLFLLLYLVISSGLLCYCYLYSNEYMQVKCLHIVRLFPPSPALPSMQFIKLQKRVAGARIKHSSQVSTEFEGRAFTAYA